LGVGQISFVAVDVANPHAFGRMEEFGTDLALQSRDLPVFEQILRDMERDFADEFRSGFIAEKPHKLRNIHQYFSAVCGVGAYPPVRCNAPEFSAVIGAQHQVNPCFFIRGPPEARSSEDLRTALNADSMKALRERIRCGGRSECATCVCSLWREPGNRSVSDFLPREAHV
jgi:hypothetical protein